MLTRELTLLLHLTVFSQLIPNSPSQASDSHTLPDFIIPCYRDDPELSECVKSTFQGIIRKLENGIPELQIPPIEPLFMDKIETFNVAGLQLKITNVTLKGASTVKILWNSVSMKTNLYSFSGEIGTMDISGNFELSGVFLVVPIRAAGTVHVTGRHIDSTIDAFVDVVPQHGVDFVKINDVQSRTYINDGSMWISNLGPFEVPINRLLNNPRNARFIMNHVAPVVDGAVANMIRKFSNRIFDKVPYDAMLLKGTGPVPETNVKRRDYGLFERFKKYVFMERIKNDLV